MPQDNISPGTEPQAMSKLDVSQPPYGIQRFAAECGPWLAAGVVVGIAKSCQSERLDNNARDGDDRSTVATQGSGK
ncbi:hypothetical protein Trco_001810 [Trichoderma cornu-damae]|uniref:Uncharacterized protein n=1 Tax=Trichoderma cornu-damae TaxID=654480 RepID=A0A9P8TX88_9HYPO|nr:hypothetical protein Trco_001810 [Trichoderma cornu-damae]